jgi:selenide,water dikinase
LAQALAVLPALEDKNLLVGTNTADDAGVYRLRDDLALVYTIDILTPAVDDPYTFGMIAAANCISDVYAMGGDPKIALNIVGFPGKGDPKTLGEILRGGTVKAQEAGVTIVGGHTFVTAETKYGLSVIGYIHPAKIITNAGAKPGDVIVLTKPIGVGTIIQSILVGKSEGIEFAPVVEAMTTLNRDAALAMREAGAHAVTDITGYGLAGHLVEMAEASHVGIEITACKIPVHKGALDILENGIFEPGITMNLNSFNSKVIKENIDDNIGNLVFTSETSGGLAIAMPAEKHEIFQKKYQTNAPIIGRITTEHPGKVKIIP